MFAKRNKSETPDKNSANARGKNGAERVNWRVVSGFDRRRWLYLPRLFNRRERIVFAVLVAIALLAFGFFSGRLVLRFTVPAPAVGGILREGALSEPRFINPLYPSSDTDRDLANLVFSKLVRYDSSGSIAMDLAAAVDVDPGGKIYTLRLRPDIEWHDGEPFDAEDVIFTIKAIQDPEYQSPLRANWQGVGVEKLDDFEVRFTLRQPYAPFIENFAVGILPAHLWRKIPRETAALSDLNLKPVGTGPYRFEKFTRREDGVITSLTLSRNRRYHREGPYLKEIRFSFYPSGEKMIAAYRRNEMDSFLFPSAASTEELAGLDLELHELKLPKVFAVFLNSSANPALGRSRVRRAMAMAIDRQTLISEVSNGRVVNSALPAGVIGFNGDIAPINFDPEEVKKILAGDGWKDANADGVLERTEGTGSKRTVQKLEITLATSDTPEMSAAAERISAMWRAAGIKAEAKALPIAELETSVIRPRNYDALLFGEVFGHDPDPFAFWHTSQIKDPGLNIALYSNRTADQLLEEARRTPDAALREEKYREFQKIVSDEIGAIFLWSPAQFYAVRKNIRGVALGAVTLPEERFNEVNLWYKDTRRALR